MDSSAISILSQAPFFVVLVWMVLHRDKSFSLERKDQDHGWQKVFAKAESNTTVLAQDHLAALREIAKEHREAQAQLAHALLDGERRIIDGQGRIRRDSAKIVALILSRAARMEPEDAKQFVRDLLEE